MGLRAMRAPRLLPRETPTEKHEVQMLFPEIFTKTVLSSFEKWKICTIAAVSLKFIFPYTRGEENSNFSLTLRMPVTHSVTLVVIFKILT